MAINHVLRLPDAWLPDDLEGELVNVEAYLEDDDVVLMVIAEGTGQIRIPIDELVELAALMEELHEKEQADGA